MSDIEIAQQTKMKPIISLAAEKFGIPAEHLDPYGHYKAKISLEYVNSLADRSTKLPGHGSRNFTMYYSEIEIGNNCILVNVNNMSRVYLTYNTFNKISTANQKFCDETKTWINYLISKSNLISGVSEKQRLQFVNKMLEQFKDTRKKIEAG